MMVCLTGDSDVSTRQSSRLSKTLSEVLTDKGALGYFIQYLDAHGGLSYVRCWLDIESFRSAAQISDGQCPHNVITRDQLEENIDVRLLSPLPSSRLDHDSLSVSTDCDSYTADSNSLYDFTSNVLFECRSSSAIDYNRPRSNDCPRVENSVNVTCDRDVSDTSCRLHKLDVKVNSVKCSASTSDKDITDTSLTTTAGDKRVVVPVQREQLSRALIDDALRIFKKYVAQEAPNPVACPEDMRNDIIEAICSEDGILHPACYDKIQRFVFDMLEQKYFNGYLRSHYNCKYQIDVLTSGNIVLQDILYNESILFYFMEFLEQEGTASLLEFWLAATNFQQQLTDQHGSYNPEEAQNDAVILYDKYFSLQATCPLGFGDKIRFLIEENICRDNGPVPDCFCQPIRLVEHVLDKHYLKQFLSSQLYFKYLSELISTVQTNGCTNSVSRSHTTGSDCSSEISNTLLAMDESTLPKRRTVKSGKTDMNIDTRQLYDPDSLWKRRRTRRLSFGRITDLGRFETDVEPKPDGKSESRITRAMRRLVNLEESKTKEEMAWQVAEMIVKDITSVTLADVPNSMQS